MSAANQQDRVVSEPFPCPGCGSEYVRRLERLYESAVEMMIPHATTDVLGDLKRLRRHIGRGVGPANGHPVHLQLIDALIAEATARLNEANDEITIKEEYSKHRNRYVWVVEWPNGFEVALSEKTAIIIAHEIADKS